MVAPLSAGAVQVKVKAVSLADAKVLTGAGEGVSGAKAYNISIIAGTALDPQAFVAHKLTLLAVPRVTEAKTCVFTVGPTLLHSLGLEVHALKPVRDTPPVSVGADQRTIGELLLKVAEIFAGVPGNEQLVKVGDRVEGAVESPRELDALTSKLTVDPTLMPVKVKDVEAVTLRITTLDPVS